MVSINSIFGSAVLLSLLHGLIPSHWLPILALSEKNKWHFQKTILVSLITYGVHVLSTIFIGIILSYLGLSINEKLEIFTHTVSGCILLLLGIWFVIKHFQHHHFHVHTNENKSEITAIIAIGLAMFLSPCLEIEALYIGIAKFGWINIVYLSVIYMGISLAGILFWIFTGKKILQRLNTHSIEHYSGIFSGIIIIICGILLIIFNE